MPELTPPASSGHISSSARVYTVKCSCCVLQQQQLGPGLVMNPSYSQTVGSVTTMPHQCEFCHKQYASRAKLMQHQRKAHPQVSRCTEVTSLVSLAQHAELEVLCSVGENTGQSPRAAAASGLGIHLVSALVTLNVRNLNSQLIQGLDHTTNESAHQLPPFLSSSISLGLATLCVSRCCSH